MATRSVVTWAGLGIVTALVLLASITVDDRRAVPFADADYAWNPCQDVFDAEGVERLGWFFEDPMVPAALVDRASGQGQYCTSTWTLNADGDVVDRVLAVGFVFFEGEADARESAVWWLFYQDEADISSLDASLVSRTSNAELEIGDGYIVAFSKNASDEIRAAARSTPDRDATTIEVLGRVSVEVGFGPDVSR
jgi:hypothetical protein